MLDGRGAEPENGMNVLHCDSVLSVLIMKHGAMLKG